MPASSPATCMLLVGDRVVLRAPVPPEAEYAMFELADIELRASEPGRVREHGYQTTAERARARLAQAGATPALARECALSMHPVLSEAFARGSAVKRVARYLGPIELFQSDSVDNSGTVYQGVFIDVGQLSKALGISGVSLQALYLAALLENEADDTIIFLATDGFTKSRKPGERSYRRPNLTGIRDLATSLSDLAAKAPTPAIESQLPRADVIAFVRTRADAANDEDTRALYQGLERTIAVRDIPERGPLSDQELWYIELKLDAGELDGVMEDLERLERARGRTPGTTYLRARASLALHLEPPKLIAERVSALALSMSSFQEISLLAAEAWLDAGEPRRAMPYARDLVDAPTIEEGLLLRAQRLLARAVGAAPEKSSVAPKQTLVDSVPVGPLPPSVPPPAPPPTLSAPDLNEARFEPDEAPTKGGLRSNTNPGIGAVNAGRSVPVPQAPSQSPPARASAGPRPARRTSPPPKKNDSVAPPKPEKPEKPAPVSSLPPPLRKPAVADVSLSAPPPPIDLDLPPPPKPVSAASFTLDLPPAPEISVAPPPPDPPPARTSRGPGPIRRMSAAIEARTPSMIPDPRAEPESEPTPFITGRGSVKPVTQKEIPDSPAPAKAREESLRPTPLRPPSNVPPMRAPMPTPMLDADLPPEVEAETRRPSTRADAPSFMQGASNPPWKAESPAPLLSRAPLFPKTSASDELAEHLSLPPGISTDVKLDALPRSILEARVQFTLLARDLGLDYRLERSIELRTDIAGIEAMQAALLELYPDHTISSPEQAQNVKRHGALLSEILSRRLDAEWIDISPNELGNWSMIVPPDTRVYPFGRVVRLVQMGYRERDLVSYFLELQTRARGR